MEKAWDMVGDGKKLYVTVRNVEVMIILCVCRCFSLSQR